MWERLQSTRKDVIYVKAFPIGWDRSHVTRALQWHHNERDGVSDHRHLHCLLSCCFRRKSKKTSKLRATGLCVWNSPVTSESPAQKASNAENVSIWWCHHEVKRVLWLAYFMSLCLGIDFHQCVMTVCWNVQGHFRTVSANGRIRYICNVFSHWPFPRDLIYTYL